MKALMSQLRKFRTYGLDGEFGPIQDILVDAKNWTLSKVIVKESSFFGFGDSVIVDQQALLDVPVLGVLGIDQTKRELKSAGHKVTHPSPSVMAPAGSDFVFPVDLMSDFGQFMAEMPSDDELSAEQQANLISFTELCGFTIQALDGDVAKIHDVVVDTSTWDAPLVVASLPDQSDRYVLVSSAYLKGLNMANRCIQYLDYSDVIEKAPTFTQLANEPIQPTKLSQHLLKYRSKSNASMRSEGAPV